MKSLLCAFSFLALSAGAAHADKIDMTPGLWSHTFKMTSGSYNMPANTDQRCMTEKDLETKMFPEMPGSKCKQDVKIGKGRATLSIRCTGRMNMKGNMEIVHTKTKYTMTGKITMSGEGMPKQKMKIKASGKRMGDCKN